MNITEYIASGILESYVLGSVSSQEKQEVECLSKIYPEIKKELTSLEETINAYTKAYSVKPPDRLKSKIFSKMDFTPIKEDEKIVASKPIISLWPKLSFAASLLLGVLLFWSFKQNNDLSDSLAENQSKFKQINEKLNFESQIVALYKSPSIKSIKLAGVEKSPSSSVDAFWDDKKLELKLVVDNLPKAPSGKQYQLWCIINGKPVDMGVIENEFNDRLFSMKTPSANVAAFAITLEKQGGSPTPTLEEMYVIGNV